MTTINLKDFYPWYTQDEYMEVSDEVAEELRANKRYEAAYRRRVPRNKAQYSLDCDGGIEYSACVFEPSPEELVLRKERLEVLCYALNSLSEKQGRRSGIVPWSVIHLGRRCNVGHPLEAHAGGFRERRHP